MRTLMVAASLALAATASAEAQEFSATPIKYFTPENVSAVVTKLGGKNATTANGENGTIVRFEANGASYTSVIVGCKDQPGCLGLLLGIPVTLEGNASFSQDAVNGFNATIPFGKAVRAPDGKSVVLYRYVIADGGIMEANLGANIAVFSILPSVFAKYLSQQVIASLDQAQPKVMQLSAVTALSPTQPTIGLELPAATVHDDIQQHMKLFAKEQPFLLQQ